MHLKTQPFTKRCKVARAYGAGKLVCSEIALSCVLVRVGGGPTRQSKRAVLRGSSLTHVAQAR